MSVKYLAAVMLALGGASMAVAQEVERNQLGNLNVDLHVHSFLSEEELMTLRIVTQSAETLAVLVPEGSTIAALAVAPDEGFIRDGMPVESATAIRDLPSLAQAREDAVQACNAARSGGAECVVILEVSPR